MSFDVLGDLNWLAVIAATVAYFALGGLWYAEPLFGRAWFRASGIEVPESGPTASFYVIPLLTCFVATVATAMLTEATGTDAVGSGVVLGLVVGVGIGLALTVLGGAFDNRPEPATYIAIYGGYHVVGLVFVGAILGAWA
ncbi:MAG TPA: DUF1761 domain-containing protein [Solirubrobacterales bacterium]|nr:DUF1761 domain-containing protein [Solirubrobacterales bacterium]